MKMSPLSLVVNQSMLFQVPQLKTFALSAGKSRYGHAFGGPPRHLGTTPPGGRQSLHLLYTLVLRDPAVGVRISGLEKLPLYYGFAYDGAPVSYRVVSDEEISVLSIGKLETPDNFPYENYPAAFPRRAVHLTRLPIYPKKIPENAMDLAGVFGLAWVPKKDRPRYHRFFVKEWPNYSPETMDHPPPKSLARMADFLHGPFIQGRPDFPCPNPQCHYHKKQGKLHVLATVPNEPVRGVSLWGKWGDFVTLIFLMCPRCRAITAYNECD